MRLRPQRRAGPDQVLEAQPPHRLVESSLQHRAADLRRRPRLGRAGARNAPEIAGAAWVAAQDAFGWNRHREERSDAAIQSRRSGPSSLDRFADARDDDRGLISSMAANDNLDLLLRRQEISARLAEGASGAQYSVLSRELNELEPVVAAIQAFQSKEKEREDLAALLREPDLDADMRAMARDELATAEAEAQTMSKTIQIALLPKDAADEGSAIIEVRAGTGGDEAALFAGDLFRMYVKYAERKRWKVEILSSSEGTAGGFKEIVAEVCGRGVFARHKFESGVHRVQRVPATETQGRIHTSAATVAVLPIAQESDFEINEADLKIDTMRSSGAGGQHVNKTESAIRITHLPTGVVVAMQEERSQHRNRAKAMAILRSRILDAKNQQLDADRAQERRSQVGSGDRSQRIRTYNFPQGRLTDHRINLTLYSLDRIMEGEGLDEVIDGLTAERQAELLAAQAAS